MSEVQPLLPPVPWAGERPCTTVGHNPGCSSSLPSRCRHGDGPVGTWLSWPAGLSSSTRRIAATFQESDKRKFKAETVKNNKFLLSVKYLQRKYKESTHLFFQHLFYFLIQESLHITGSEIISNVLYQRDKTNLKLLIKKGETNSVFFYPFPESLN